MPDQPHTLVVCSSDENYFPLVKGLVLSILEGGRAGADVGLGFVDIGCAPASLAWLAEHGVQVRQVSAETMGALAAPSLGYQRAQVCRPFLPKLFPEARRFIWIDCDAWVQDTSILAHLSAAVAARPDQLFITPECHYSYVDINVNSLERHEEMRSYYEPTFGAEVAARMCVRPTLNSGLFAMAAEHPLWEEWGRELERLFVREYEGFEKIVRHMAEQIALNVLATRRGCVTLVDPLCNYVCLWTPPFRDRDGVVKVALPPHAPLGVIHLVAWKQKREVYLANGLLYREGAYLSDEEHARMADAQARAAFR